MSEIRSFNAVRHRVRLLSVGCSVENARELRPLQLINIAGSTGLPPAQRASKKK